jgi:hypothetical protein
LVKLGKFVEKLVDKNKRLKSVMLESVGLSLLGKRVTTVITVDYDRG